MHINEPVLFFLKYMQNTGASFSILRGYTWFFIAFAVIVLIVIFYLYPRMHIKYRPYIGLIIGGTIGNLIDRVYLGYVIDFIDFKIWPVFNIADTAVCIGAAFLIIYIWKDDKK